jgi:hypothetical protein
MQNTSLPDYMIKHTMALQSDPIFAAANLASCKNELSF